MSATYIVIMEEQTGSRSRYPALVEADGFDAALAQAASGVHLSRPIAIARKYVDGRFGTTFHPVGPATGWIVQYNERWTGEEIKRG